MPDEQLASLSLGSGMAENAKLQSSLRNAYKRYAIEAQTNGETPVPFEQWVKQSNNG